jgi:hypothetical protein
MLCAPPEFGAVYTPLELIVPTVAFPPGNVSTSQVTAVLALPFTVAENARVWPGVSPPRFGAIATVVELEAATVIVADALRVASATELAFSVTVAGDGAEAGAVYVIAAPEALVVADSVPQAAPVHPVPLSVQLTPLFCASFVTVAVKF